MSGSQRGKCPASLDLRGSRTCGYSPETGMEGIREQAFQTLKDARGFGFWVWKAHGLSHLFCCCYEIARRTQFKGGKGA